MAGNGPKVTLVFAGDASQLERTIGGVGRSVDGLNTSAGSKFDAFRSKATLAATVVGGALVGMAKVTGQAASEQEQALGGVEAVFKSSADQVKQWASGAADAVGLSKTAYLSMAAPVGASLKSVGMSTDEAAAKTKTLIERGADLAATFGGSTQEAVEAMGAALRGEFDPLERYGVALSANAVNAELAARGQDKLGGSALEAAKKQAIMDLILRQSADAAGQFGREGNTAAGAQERFNAHLEDAKSALGQVLLPVMSAAANALAGFAMWAEKNSGLVTTLAFVIGGLAAAVFVMNGAMAAWRAISTIVTAGQWLLNVALSANPIGLVILAIAALVAAFVILWNKSEGFRNFWIGAWEMIKGAFGAAKDFVVNGFNALMSFFGSIPGKVASIMQSVKDWIVRKWNEAVSFVRGVPGMILGALGNLGNLLVGAGKSLITGLWNGIGSMIGWIKDRIMGLVGDVKGWFTNFFGIGSPSKLMANEVGRWLPPGIAEGMDDPKAMRPVYSASREVANAVLGGAPTSGARGVAGGGGGLGIEFIGNTDSVFATAFMKLVRSGQIRVVAA